MVVPGTTAYREFPPPRDLEGQLACLWMQQVPAGVAARPQLVVPNGSVEIVCQPACGEAHLIGALTTPRRVQPEAGQMLIGLRFRPGAAATVLGVGTREMRDIDVPLECCWGAAGVALGERVAEVASIPAAFTVLLRAIRSRVESLAEPTFAAEVRERLQPWQARTVAGLGADLFLSERQLRRRVLAVFGLGPKELQRTFRFQVFLALVRGLRGDQVQLARIATWLGYSDQSHLNRECLRLTDLSPGRLLKELAESCGRNHDHTVSFAPLRVRFLQDLAAGVGLASA